MKTTTWFRDHLRWSLTEKTDTGHKMRTYSNRRLVSQRKSGFYVPGAGFLVRNTRRMRKIIKRCLQTSKP